MGKTDELPTEIPTAALLSLLAMTDDICEVCGKVVGHGMALFHLSRCGEHAEPEEDGPMQQEEAMRK